MSKLQQVFDTAVKLATKKKKPPLELRFSRYSSISNIKEFSQDDLEGGVFLALCRVLILNQKTVEGEITAADVDDAMRLHFDAIYSSST